MTFKWEIHKPLIKRLYIDEGRTLDEIQEFMKTVHDFTPSRRSWQLHISRWGFKKQHRTEIYDEKLVARIKELWAKNFSHPEILEIVVKEGGWKIDTRDLKQIRAQHKLSLRISRPLIAAGDKSSTPAKETQPSSDQITPAQPAVAVLAETQFEDAIQPESQSERRGRARHSQKSDGTSSRFPSEMTIEEARLLLGLDDAQYRQLGSQFKKSCQQNGILKKTSVSSELWETLKSQLISEIPQLQRALVRFPDNLEMKMLALEIICSNITKRIRVATKKIGLPEAKNILGLNPNEARQMREALCEVLRDANCSSKSDVTAAEWKQLKKRWGEKCEAVQRAIDLSPDHADYNKTSRAIELLAKNVIARIQQTQKQNGEYVPRRKQKEPTVPISQRSNVSSIPDAGISQMAGGDSVGLLSNTGPEDEPSYNTIASQSLQSRYGRTTTGLPAAGGILRTVGQAPASHAHDAVPGMPDLSATGHHVPPAIQGDSQQQFLFQAAASAFQNTQPMQVEPVAAYFRLHHASGFPTVPLWIATMNEPSVMEVRKIVSDRHPDAFCARIEGIVKGGMGVELPLKIEDDEELRAYMSHLQGAAPTFRVQLVWKQP
ncbi:unnamed protein product [Clonostachys rhizophaga]|uniref:Clr5 domain-containing protein n=1 Tax=Clonostachys rhizophaga TaxID=160324 RepID=A0A9N9YM40_9HYPO|nr:unnamed protein product [Clonostachys rhizophaga]